jgi:FkbM family methyltransferase
MIDVGVFLGRFEPEVAAAIDALCTPGWVVLDIGANIGAHALRLGRRIGTAGCVYAFEPTSYAFEKLERNVALNPTLRIIPVRAALSDRSVPAQTISYRSSWRTDGQRSVQSSVVDFVRLDDWCAQRGVDRIDLIKIDVDGNEYSVVTGAMKMITSSLPLFLLEAGAWHFEDRATNPWAILEGLGYRFWNAMRRKPYNSLAEIRAELPPSDPDKGFSINLVASTRALEATW